LKLICDSIIHFFKPARFIFSNYIWLIYLLLRPSARTEQFSSFSAKFTSVSESSAPLALWLSSKSKSESSWISILLIKIIFISQIKIFLFQAVNLLQRPFRRMFYSNAHIRFLWQCFLDDFRFFITTRAFFLLCLPFFSFGDGLLRGEEFKIGFVWARYLVEWKYRIWSFRRFGYRKPVRFKKISKLLNVAAA